MWQSALEELQIERLQGSWDKRPCFIELSKLSGVSRTLASVHICYIRIHRNLEALFGESCAAWTPF